MSEENEINVTLNINELLKAYNKEDFMRKVFSEAINKDNKMLVNGLKDHLIAEVLRTTVFDEIKDAVIGDIKTKISSEQLLSHYNYTTYLNKMITECVQDNKHMLDSHVKASISQKDMKKKVAKHISHVVEERVMNALGEVCEGCGEDCY